MKRKKLLSMMLVLALGSSMLAGCGSDGGNESSGSESKESSQTEESSQADDAGDEEEADDAGDSESEAGGAEAADIPKFDPDKTYDLSYFGYWCLSTYEHDNYVESLIQDTLNLDITVEVSDTADAMDTMLASGEMPDCMWSDKGVAYMEDNELIRTIPREMVEYYCPTLIEYYDEFPLMYELTTNADGDFRYLTGVTFQFVDYYLQGDYYRYDWIEKLGIDLGVEVEQVDERLYVAKEGIEWSKFVEIMDAFTNQDPNGDGSQTYGMTAQTPGLNQFYSGFGFHSGVNEVNGRAEQYYVMDEYKEYLKGFADLYAKGYIDPDIMAGNRQLGWDKVNAGICGYWITSTSSLQSWANERPPLTLLERIPEAKVLVTPGLRPDGGVCQAVTNSSPAYGGFYVNANVDDEFLAKILQFVEFTLFGNGDKDLHCSMFYGEKGVDWEWNEDESMPVILNALSSGEKGTWSFSQFGQDRPATSWIGDEPLFTVGAKYWSKGGSWMQWQSVPYKEDLAGVTDITDINTEIGGDINAKVSEFRSQAILGQIDIDAEWDNYISVLEGYGYTRLMDEYEKLDPLADVIANYN